MQLIPKVYGHARSGNHLLAAFLHKVFFPHLGPRHVVNTNTGHWSQRKGAARYCLDNVEQTESKIRIPYAGLLGSHAFPGNVNPESIVYVVRDGRDVAVSFWNWKKIRPSSLSDDISLNEYLRLPIDWKGTPGVRSRERDDYLLFDHWRDHVSAWLATGAFWVRYEELVQTPSSVIERFSRQFHFPVVGDPELPRPVGWNPSQGPPKIGAWQQMLPPDLQELFDAKVPGEHPGRYEP